ncbi:putative 2-oxoacid ferredoxin oxidoreductase [Vibrio chagasii]|nr:putative 2-oxoacid ferredoxin oxidoreductase [Vibrio chagasii]CAH7102392.1 putative 2-oxoacid ferredoxin oxidoreductase [Vibrio chagasii]
MKNNFNLFNPSEVSVQESVSLLDKLDCNKRNVQLNGMEALVRFLVEQKDIDVKNGKNTGIFVSGYPGSPIGGFDSQLIRHKDILDNQNIFFSPGLNEEIASTAVMGSQMATSVDDSPFDGIVGVWFGKTPGLDRALDSIKHANYVGTTVCGGAIAIVGADPECKSSTIPNECEFTFRSAKIPVFSPSSIKEVIEFGLKAIAISRATGVWCGLKYVTDIADGEALVELQESYTEILAPLNGLGNSITNRCFLPHSVETEKKIMSSALEQVEVLANQLGLNEIIRKNHKQKIGIVTSGINYLQTESALKKLFDKKTSIELPPVLKLGLIWPISKDIIYNFVEGLETVIVIEDKDAFIEEQVKSLLYNEPVKPIILGKRDLENNELFPSSGSLDSDKIERLLQKPFNMVRTENSVDTRLAIKTELSRNAWFCSGCPHSRSTKSPTDALVGGGIGCHTLSMFMGRGVEYITQMGGEGSAWIGISPFVTRPHIFQNVGDGTFVHSASLGIRAAVAAKVNITFKILLNGVVSMTGGQRIVGNFSIQKLCGFLESEGVQSIAIISDDIDLNDKRLPGSVSVFREDDYLNVQERFEKTEGVTVIVFDKQCALERRRREKRTSVSGSSLYISTDICDGCGDCGRKSNCISLGWQETKLGRKIRLHEKSCNQDLACVEGECPSFFTVSDIKTTVKQQSVSPKELVEPDLTRVRRAPWRCIIAGVGGTGVVTVSSIISHAAWVEGRKNTVLNQTGMAQKGGAVVSHVSIDVAEDMPARIGLDEGNNLIVLDIISMFSKDVMSFMDKEHNNILVDLSYTPTSKEIGNSKVIQPELDEVYGYLGLSNHEGQATISDFNNVLSDKGIDLRYQNMFLLGVAYQKGMIPLNESSIIKAIEMNNVSVVQNITSFREGRYWCLDAKENVETNLTIDEDVLRRLPYLNETDNSVLGRYFDTLVSYQDKVYADRYLDELAVFFDEVTYHKYQSILMRSAKIIFDFFYVKDEFEVARLSLGVRGLLEEKYKTKDFNLYAHLTLPYSKNKIKIPECIFKPLYTAIKLVKRLRETRFNSFRKRKDNLLRLKWLLEVNNKLIAKLDDNSLPLVQEALLYCESIRGYGSVRSNNFEKYQHLVDEIVISVTEGNVKMEPEMMIHIEKV